MYTFGRSYANLPTQWRRHVGRVWMSRFRRAWTSLKFDKEYLFGFETLVFATLFSLWHSKENLKSHHMTSLMNCIMYWYCKKIAGNSLWIKHFLCHWFSVYSLKVNLAFPWFSGERTRHTCAISHRRVCVGQELSVMMMTHAFLRYRRLLLVTAQSTSTRPSASD